MLYIAKKSDAREYVDSEIAKVVEGQPLEDFVPSMIIVQLQNLDLHQYVDVETKRNGFNTAEFHSREYLPPIIPKITITK